MLSKFGVIFLVLFLSFAAVTFGQEWQTTNQITISWDAVTELQEGIVVPEGDVIEYRVYLSDAVNDPDKVDPVELGTTADTFYVITLVDEGQYFVGLQTIRKLADWEYTTESIIGWTDDPAICSGGNIFGIRYFLSPLIPTELRLGN